MIKTLTPGEVSGTVTAPSSKSAMHRLLICACLGDSPTTILCDRLSADTEATIKCMRALGADIELRGEGEVLVRPIAAVPGEVCHLFCGESGSTLRFLLPLVGALGAKAVFHMEGRLGSRPLSPLWEELEGHGMSLRKEGDLLHCEGRLTPGEYALPGNVSSQYISGLLMALPRLCGSSTLTVTGGIESAAYITMTEDVLALGGADINKKENIYYVGSSAALSYPPQIAVEGDWSNGAFFLCMGALSEKGVTVRSLDTTSSQGDKSVLDILRGFGADVSENPDGITVKKGSLRPQVIDASPIPDLIPVLSIVAAAAKGESRIINAGRLRLKESDRLLSTKTLISSLGGDAEELSDELIIHGRGSLEGGTADSFSDHRIAMAAAVAAGICSKPVTVVGSECVAKSFPHFWDVYDTLTGGTE